MRTAWCYLNNNKLIMGVIIMKGMRVRDQEIIQKRVVETITENGLKNTTKFIKDKKLKELKEFQKRHKSLIRLQDKIDSLKKDFEIAEKRLAEDVNSFNHQNFKNSKSSTSKYDSNCTTKVGLKYSYRGGYDYNESGRVDYPGGVSIVYTPDNCLYAEIRDELALETMSSDFNAKELIAKFVKRFGK